MTQAIIDEVLELHELFVYSSIEMLCESCCADPNTDISQSCKLFHTHDSNPNNRCDTVRIITKERE